MAVADFAAAFLISSLAIGNKLDLHLTLIIIITRTSTPRLYMLKFIFYLSFIKI